MATTNEQTYSAALERAKTIAARMKENITRELLGTKVEATERLNPYGSGTGLPTLKCEMLLPMLIAHKVTARDTLHRIEKECNVIVSPPKDTQGDVTIKIQGTEPDIAYAKSRIFEVMTGEPPPLSMFAPKDREGNKTVNVLVPANRVGLVIGKGTQK
jgi:hypothetical protein